MVKRHVSDLTPKFRAALKIRDAVMSLMTEEENSSDTPFGKYFWISVNGLEIAHRVPLSTIVRGDHQSITVALGFPQQNLPFSLEIWLAEEGGKVLFLEWDTDGNINLVRFTRGSWEQRALELSAAASLVERHDFKVSRMHAMSRETSDG